MTNPYSEPLVRDALPPPTKKRRSTVPRWQTWCGLLLMLIGGVIFAFGFDLFARNDNSNAEADSAMMVLAIGTACGSAGLSLMILRPIFALAAAIAGPPILYMVAAILYWPYVLIWSLFFKP